MTAKTVAEPSAAGAPTPQPLIYAARRGDEEAVRRLLAERANVMEADGTGASALHWASSEGHAGVAAVLIAAGAHPDAQTALLSTPLHWAAEAGGPSLVRLLLAGSASPDPQNKWKITPLAQASTHARTLFLRRASGYSDLPNTCGLVRLH